jgi:serine/threonine-protein kinase
VDEHPVKPGDVIAERLRIDRLIGSGGMGAVFAATHLKTGRQVAVKVLVQRKVSAAARIRFEQEALATGRITHPNVVIVHDAGAHDAIFYISMELLEGESLEDRLMRGVMAPADVVHVLREAAAGLKAAHQAGVIHRDLKPPNLFLAKEADREKPRVKILDFGIAKLAPDAGALIRTGSLQMVGTPHYMAPEQLDGSAHVDARTDVFALGVTAFRALAGRKPFEGADAQAALARMLSEQAPPLRSVRPSVPPALAAIVDRAIRRNPSERFQSMDELLTALDALGPSDLIESASIDDHNSTRGLRPIRSGKGAPAAEPVQREAPTAAPDPPPARESVSIPPTVPLDLRPRWYTNPLVLGIAAFAIGLAAVTAAYVIAESDSSPPAAEPQPAAQPVERDEPPALAQPAAIAQPALGQEPEVVEVAAPQPEEPPRRLRRETRVETRMAETTEEPPVESTMDVTTEAPLETAMDTDGMRDRDRDLVL